MNPHLGNGIGRFVSQTLAEQTGGSPMISECGGKLGRKRHNMENIDRITVAKGERAFAKEKGDKPDDGREGEKEEQRRKRACARRKRGKQMDT